MGFPDGPLVKNLPASVEGSIPGSGRFTPGEGSGNPLVFLPGKSHGQRSLAGSSPGGRKRGGGDSAAKQQQQHNKPLVCSELCSCCHCLNSRARSLSPQRKPCPLSRHPQPLAALIHFLCLGICLFWTFHSNGIITRYVALCNWLLSLRIVFSAFSCVIACASAHHSFLLQNNIPSYGCSFIHRCTFGWFPHFCYYEDCCGKHLWVGFPDGPLVKNLPASVEGSIPGSGRSPLEKEVATHSSFLAWEIPWTEEPGVNMCLHLSWVDPWSGNAVSSGNSCV